MLSITQGDAVTLNFTAKNGAGVPVDLTGAVFTTYMRGPNGVVVSFPNSQHTANPDQVGHTGEFTLALSTSDTSSVGLGPNKEVVTKIVQGASTLYYHGMGILTVLADVPLQ